MLIPTFREVQDDITAMLRQQGYLAAILVDLSPLAHIEKSFGGAAFRSLREQVDPLLPSMRERFRQDDFVTRDEREGDRFLLFLSGPRRGDTPFRSETLRKLVARVEEYLNPRVGPPDAAVPAVSGRCWSPATASCCGARSRARSARSCGSWTTPRPAR